MHYYQCRKLNISTIAIAKTSLTFSIKCYSETAIHPLFFIIIFYYSSDDDDDDDDELFLPNQKPTKCE